MIGVGAVRASARIYVPLMVLFLVRHIIVKFVEI